MAENDYLASAATCTAAATYYKSCHCGATSLSTENESTFASGAPLGHMWDTTYTVDNTATESANGSKSIHCTVCSETKDTVQIMATGNTAVLENADGVCSTWDVKKYDGGWVTTGATAIRVKGSHDGSDMLKAHVWRNGSSFRFITNYEATTQFNQISFDIKGDGVSTVKIQFFGPNGIYVTLSLGVAANTWNTQTISLADSNWKLTFAGNDYPLAAAISSMGGSLGVNSAEDLIKTCSQFAIIFNGQNTSGSEGDIYLDNIKFESVATPATAVAPIAITNNLTIDWEGLTTGSGLNSTDWTVQKYNNGWETVATSSNMNVRSRYGSTVVNMVSDSTTRNFAYTLASPLSDVNHFSMDVGNDFQSNTGIKIKVALILSDSSKVYLVGDANNFQTIAYTATQSTITLTNDSFSLGGKSIAKLQVTTQGTNGGTTQYLYTDNIVLSYVAD